MTDRPPFSDETRAALLREFPGAAASPYLDSSSTGLMPARTVEAVGAFLADRRDNGKTPSLWEEALGKARDGFARLIQADRRDVAFTKNCTEGVNIVASGLPWREGDNVVLCADLEHPANIYPWLAQQQRGLQIKRVAPTGLAIDPDAMLAAIDDRTRAVAVSSVTFVPGFRTNLAALIKLCRARDVFLLVDATQSVGVLETDVKTMPVDGLVTSTHKYLMGVYGQGLIYCRREWAERIQPMHLGKPGVESGEGHPALDGYDYRLRPDAGRFESGHLPIGACALATSIGLLEEVGPAAVEAQATGLAARLASGLADMELPLNFDPYGEGGSQIVTLGDLGRDGLYEVSDPLLKSMHEALLRQGVQHSARRGQLRFSFHLYNTEADVDLVLDTVDSIVSRRDRAAGGGGN